MALVYNIKRTWLGRWKILVTTPVAGVTQWLATFKHKDDAEQFKREILKAR